MTEKLALSHLARLERRSWRIFLAFLISLPVLALLLVFGVAVAGIGHGGSMVLLVVAAAFGVVSILLLLYSALLRFQLVTRSGVFNLASVVIFLVTALVAAVIAAELFGVEVLWSLYPF